MKDKFIDRFGQKEFYCSECGENEISEFDNYCETCGNDLSEVILQRDDEFPLMEKDKNDIDDVSTEKLYCPKCGISFYYDEIEYEKIEKCHNCGFNLLTVREYWNKYEKYTHTESFIAETGQKIIAVQLTPRESITKTNTGTSETYNSLNTKTFIFALDSIETKIITEIENFNYVFLIIRRDDFNIQVRGRNFIGQNMNIYFHKSVLPQSQ